MKVRTKRPKIEIQQECNTKITSRKRIIYMYIYVREQYRIYYDYAQYYSWVSVGMAGVSNCGKKSDSNSVDNL